MKEKDYPVVGALLLKKESLLKNLAIFKDVLNTEQPLTYIQCEGSSPVGLLTSEINKSERELIIQTIIIATERKLKMVLQQLKELGVSYELEGRSYNI